MCHLTGLEPMRASPRSLGSAKSAALRQDENEHRVDREALHALPENSPTCSQLLARRQRILHLETNFHEQSSKATTYVGTWQLRHRPVKMDCGQPPFWTSGWCHTARAGRAPACSVDCTRHRWCRMRCGHATSGHNQAGGFLQSSRWPSGS